MAAVLMGGCDKTTPALLMGAISANLPAIYLPAGPMLRGNWDGKILGSGTDVWKYWADRCAGVITDEEWKGVEIGIARSPGFCMTMGTASTMTALSEALGMTLPGASSIPAADSNHVRLAMDTRPPRRRDGVGRSEALRHSHARSLSATPSPSTWPSAARPTPSFISSRSPAVSASICRLRASMKSRVTFRCSPTFVPPANI